MDVHETSREMAQADARLAIGGDFDEKVWCSYTRMEIDHTGYSPTGARVQSVHNTHHNVYISICVRVCVCMYVYLYPYTYYLPTTFCLLFSILCIKYIYICYL